MSDLFFDAYTPKIKQKQKNNEATNIDTATNQQHNACCLAFKSTIFKPLKPSTAIFVRGHLLILLKTPNFSLHGICQFSRTKLYIILCIKAGSFISRATLKTIHQSSIYGLMFNTHSALQRLFRACY